MTNQVKPSLINVRSAHNSQEFDEETDPIEFNDDQQISYDDDTNEALAASPTKEDYDDLLKTLIFGKKPDDQELLSLPVYLGVTDLARDLFSRQSNSAGTALAPVDAHGKAVLRQIVETYLQNTAQCNEALEQGAFEAVNAFNEQSQTHKFERQPDGSFILVERLEPPKSDGQGMTNDLEQAHSQTIGLHNGH